MSDLETCTSGNTPCACTADAEMTTAPATMRRRRDAVHMRGAAAERAAKLLMSTSPGHEKSLANTSHPPGDDQPYLRLSPRPRGGPLVHRELELRWRIAS